MDIDFEKGEGLVPAIIQDFTTQKVLMLGYMNREALEKTQTLGQVTFYSRTRQQLWTKGETSGNFLEVKEILADCDQDTLLIKVRPTGPVCHTGADTCFKEDNKDQLHFINYLKGIIKDRKHSTDEKSYTKSLFDKGINKVAQKVGEEAVELVIEAKDDNKDLFKGEAADLLFHYLVLLEAKNVDFNEIIEELTKRHE
ncbi:MAG: bifunctional phosphoribosyl-AMP cyclohydrolase/phosphoribosyl-ATP diphosphatase HisIE [Cytophagales bacterium]|nr:bifunctional phosphoribosyl-AMP cyclohydrolase/phosphoribosyl-ATP diphosphatase HisIE [Cytophagales bacterium]